MIVAGLALLAIAAATVVIGLPQLAGSSRALGSRAGGALPSQAGDVPLGAAPGEGAPSPRKEDPAPAGSVGPTTGPVVREAGPVPRRGSGEFDVAGGQGRLLGRSGTVRRFRVAVERGSDEDPATFAGFVEATLADERSWTGDGRTRMQRVPDGVAADFTVYLATAETAGRMCLAGGVDIRIDGQPYTSCRASGKVIVNLSRWRLSVPDYVGLRVPLDQYRQYVINHEVGHELGHGHEDCPAKGRPAPVMVQQSITLRGCRPYSWPRLDGERYAGPSI